MSDGSVKVLVVDDAITYRKIISDLLGTISGIQVVGWAANGGTALQKIEQLRPDLVTLDLNMPQMDGLEVLRRLKNMPNAPAVIVLSASGDQGAEVTLKALGLGAFDFVVKPEGRTFEENTARLRQELGPRIEAFARARQMRDAAARRTAPPPVRPVVVPPPRPTTAPSPTVSAGMGRAARPASSPAGTRPQVVAIGISTGGPQSLAVMVPRLPADLGVPVLIVQHMPPLFTKSLADSLNARCPLEVCEAQQGQLVRPGVAYIAPGGRQMKVQREGASVVIRLADDPPEHSCRPSVDYLFRSVADVYGGRAVGVIMTGMGNDGTQGCRVMARQGATIVAQDAASCVVYGMPKTPTEEGTATIVAPLDRLADEITRLVREGVPAAR